MSKSFERCQFCNKLLLKGQECPERGREDHREGPRVSEREVWRDSNGSPLKFQEGDHVRITSRESFFPAGFVYAYSESADGITYNFGRGGVHNHKVPEDDLELSPEYRIEYSAVGFTEGGNYVNIPMWGDIMDVRASGFKTVREAEDHAPNLFGQDERVAYVLISESLQEWSGGGWRSGRTVARVERPKVDGKGEDDERLAVR